MTTEKDGTANTPCRLFCKSGDTEDGIYGSYDA